MIDSNKDLSVVSFSDPCKERSVQVQTVLGRVDIHSVTEKVNPGKERGTYTKWKDKDRLKIGDYARVNDNSTTLRKYSFLG